MKFTFSTSHPVWYDLRPLTEDADTLAYCGVSGRSPITAGDYVFGAYPDKGYLKADEINRLRRSGHLKE